MIVETGHFALVLALVLALVQSSLPLWGARRRSAALMGTAAPAALAQFAFVAYSFLTLTLAHVQSDFSVRNVVENSHSAKPLIYKISGVWGNHEGSMLLWVLILALFGALVAGFSRTMPSALHAATLAVQGWIASAFLLFILLTSDPFARISPAPLEGQDLNPLLQDPGLAIHPPLLYFGYVGFSIVFSFAAAALIGGRVDAGWARFVRPWVLMAWISLTLGIAMGSYWAYYTLGWGGFWFWDPVENASLMPWLTGTAFLHSVMMQEKRGMMKSWNVWLIFSTFMLTILGTLLTRSGLVQSVHAFAQSSIGSWFYGFLIITMAVCLFTFLKQRDHLKSENRLESLVSRESSFLFNNLVLLAACFTVLWGTLFPVLSEYVQGSKVTVGAPFYNRVNLPIGLSLLLLTGVGPLLAWRSTSLRSIRRNFVLPGIAVGVTAVALMIGGIRPWADGDDMQATIFSLIAFSLGAGVITAIGAEFLRGAGVVREQTGRGLAPSMLLLVRKNTRRYGGYLVHFGIVVMFIGIAGGAFNQSHEQEMGFGDEAQLGGYRIVCQSFTQD